MKERPIIFTATMVRAIREGRKSQTRRIVKPQPDQEVVAVERHNQETYLGKIRLNQWEKEIKGSFKCPYGKPGDQLFVRETVQIWGKWKKNGTTDTGRQKWKFIPSRKKLVHYAEKGFQPTPKDRTEEGWYTRPAIHAPKWTNRIKLEIEEIRAERLQDITEEDAKSEGVKGASIGGPIMYFDYKKEMYQFLTAIESFRSLFESINGPESWNANPWVWVIKFRTI